MTIIDARERAARAWLPSQARSSTIWVGPGGELIRVNEDGTVTAIQPGGHPRPGVASEAWATKGTAR